MTHTVRTKVSLVTTDAHCSYATRGEYVRGMVNTANRFDLVAARAQYRRTFHIVSKDFR